MVPTMLDLGLVYIGSSLCVKALKSTWEGDKMNPGNKLRLGKGFWDNIVTGEGRQSDVKERFLAGEQGVLWLKQNKYLLSENCRKFSMAALDMLYKCPLISTAWTKYADKDRHSFKTLFNIFLYSGEQRGMLYWLLVWGGKNMHIKDMSRQNYFQLITVMFISKVVLIFSESSVYAEGKNVKEKQRVDF